MLWCLFSMANSLCSQSKRYRCNHFENDTATIERPAKIAPSTSRWVTRRILVRHHGSFAWNKQLNWFHLNCLCLIKGTRYRTHKILLFLRKTRFAIYFGCESKDQRRFRSNQKCAIKINLWEILILFCLALFWINILKYGCSNFEMWCFLQLNRIIVLKLTRLLILWKNVA